MALWGDIFNNFIQLYGDEMARQNHDYGQEDELRAGQEYIRRRNATSQPSGDVQMPFDPSMFNLKGLFPMDLSMFNTNSGGT